jgi:putative phosphoribosyl transferase
MSSDCTAGNDLSMFEHSTLDLGPPLLPGDLSTMAGSRGMVVFAHADGGARTTWRSVQVAQRLQRRELSTLLFDLLSPEEADLPAQLQDVELLTQRLLQAVQALPPALRALPLGVLASDAGAAAALVAAARHPQQVHAVVSRGGRPDLAAQVLGDVRAPTMLIVGAADTEVLDLNRWAYARLRCEKRIDIVPRATHQFLEAGALDIVAQRAGDWFCAHLPAAD